MAPTPSLPLENLMPWAPPRTVVGRPLGLPGPRRRGDLGPREVRGAPHRRDDHPTSEPPGPAHVRRPRQARRGPRAGRRERRRCGRIQRRAPTDDALRARARPARGMLRPPPRAPRAVRAARLQPGRKGPPDRTEGPGLSSGGPRGLCERREDLLVQRPDGRTPARGGPDVLDPGDDDEEPYWDEEAHPAHGHDRVRRWRAVLVGRGVPCDPRGDPPGGPRPPPGRRDRFRTRDPTEGPTRSAHPLPERPFGFRHPGAHEGRRTPTGGGGGSRARPRGFRIPPDPARDLRADRTRSPGVARPRASGLRLSPRDPPRPGPPCGGVRAQPLVVRAYRRRVCGPRPRTDRARRPLSDSGPRSRGASRPRRPLEGRRLIRP